MKLCGVGWRRVEWLTRPEVPGSILSQNVELVIDGSVIEAVAARRQSQGYYSNP